MFIICFIKERENMRRKYKFAVILLMIMLLLAACGKSTSKKRVKEEYKSPTSFNESLEALKTYGDGEYTFTVSLLDLSNEKNAENILITEKSYKESREFSLEIQSKEEGKNTTKKLPAVVAIINNQLVVNFDSLLGESLDVKDILGSYAVKLPEYKKPQTEKNYVFEIAKAFNKNIQDREEDINIISIKEGKELKQAIENAYIYIKSNEDVIDEYVKNSLDGVDFDSYFENFIKQNAEDIIAAADLLGYEVSKEELEKVIEKVKFVRIEGTDVDVLALVNDLVEAGNLLDESVYEKLFSALGLEISARASMLEKEYNISYDVVLNELGMKLSISCSFKAGSPVVAGAKNLSSMTEIAKAMIKDEVNKDKLIERLSDFLVNISGGLISLPEKPEKPEEPAEKVYYSVKYGEDKLFRAYYDSSVVKSFSINEDEYLFTTDNFQAISLGVKTGINVNQFAEGIKLSEKDYESYEYSHKEYEGSQYKGYSYTIGIDGTYLTTVALDIDGGILLVEFMANSEITDLDDTLNKIIIPYSEKESE